jgi:hypothetical protein
VTYVEQYATTPCFVHRLFLYPLYGYRGVRVRSECVTMLRQLLPERALEAQTVETASEAKGAAEELIKLVDGPSRNIRRLPRR